MSQNQDAKAAKGSSRRLFPLEGTVTNVRRLTGTKGGKPQDYAIFTFAYGVTGRNGKPRTDVRTAKAFGKCLTNISDVLIEGEKARLLCEFDTTEQGQSIKAISVAAPRKQQAA